MVQLVLWDLSGSRYHESAEFAHHGQACTGPSLGGCLDVKGY